MLSIIRSSARSLYVLCPGLVLFKIHVFIPPQQNQEELTRSSDNYSLTKSLHLNCCCYMWGMNACQGSRLEMHGTTCCDYS